MKADLPEKTFLEGVMSENLGFGIVGCGVIADFHANAIASLSDRARLIGVADVNADASETFARRHGTFAFESVEQMLESDEVDVVNICTPSGYHADSVVLAAESGKHIIVEKPVGITYEQLDRIKGACKKSGKKVAVISQNRFSRSIDMTKKAIEDGLLGTVVCGDIYMKYHRSQEYYDSGSWRGTRRIDGGGALMNQGIHGVDLLLYLMGEVKSVYAVSKTLARNIEVEDTLSAVLEYENGATGVIQATTSVYPGYPRRLDINGSKGSVVLDETSIIRWDFDEGARFEDVVLRPAFTSGASTPTAISPDGHIKQISDMIDAIRENRSPLVTLEDGIKAVELILAIYRSAETGLPVDPRKRS